MDNERDIVELLKNHALSTVEVGDESFLGPEPERTHVAYQGALEIEKLRSILKQFKQQLLEKNLFTPDEIASW